MIALVSYAENDRALADAVAAACRDAGYTPRLDERDDWLMHALRPGLEDVDHVVVVVSAANAGSWWLPFHLGRAVERGIAPVVLCIDPEVEPRFLERFTTVDRVDAVVPRLTPR